MAPEVETSLLRWIILFPLAGFLLNAICARQNRTQLAKFIGPGVLFGAFLVAMTGVAKLWALPVADIGQGALIDPVFSWISVGPLQLDFTLRLDALTSVMLFLVTGVGSLIHLYSVGYMEDDADISRFFAYLNLFVASMLILVLADSLAVLFIGWEGVGLCSYLLIGFWYKDMENADAGQKAMIVNRIGDAAFLIGMFLLFWSLYAIGVPTLNLQAINANAGALAAANPWLPTAVCLLLLFGATGKSAQVPLFVWLPDAMAGPTPVSALIHAATMVTAGVYMIARLSFLFVEAPDALVVVAWIGGITCLFAATMAIVQKDLKKVLAYSTISQIGYMMMGVGVGAFAAGIFHLMMHAFFKGLLFLGAGAVMHALQGELRLSHMGGLEKKMPITAKTFLVGSLAIAGVPGFAAFFSKDMVLENAYMGGFQGPWALGTIAAGFTAFYIFRAYFLAFTGESRLDPEKAEHVHEMPRTMTVPMTILAVLAFAGGWIGMPLHLLWGDEIGKYLAPALAANPFIHGEHQDTGLILTLMLTATTVGLFGIFWAWLLYVKSPGMLDRVYAMTRPVYPILVNRYWVDEIYDALIVMPYKRASRWVWSAIDVVIVDGVVNGVATTVELTSGIVRRLQTGNVQHYALGMLLGAVVLLGTVWVIGG
jgi:NADH-quinone oxidoreductase subunit L